MCHGPRALPVAALPPTPLQEKKIIVERPSSSQEGNDEKSSTAPPTTNRTHAEEPNLHSIPSDLNPIYGSLPIGIRIAVWAAAAIAMACLTWGIPCPEWLEVLIVISNNSAWPSSDLVGFVVKTCIISFATEMVLQEWLAPPSRITTKDMAKQYCLPSTLSHYNNLRVPSINNNNTKELGVHYLRYDGVEKSASSSSLFKGIYLNHGFGASSLSWLPVLPRLVERLKTNVGVGHDAVGFGYTDRPVMVESQGLEQNLHPYTLQGSAEIGAALLQREVLDNTTNGEDNKPVILMGHSMGTLTTMRMTLELPKTQRKWVVLVAPALGMLNLGGDLGGVVPAPKKPQPMTILESLLVALKEALIQTVSIGLQYFLKRLVGLKHFWLHGLQLLVWHNPKTVSDSDALRYQWPAVGQGWEEGLTNFGRAMLQPVPISDVQLLERVLRPETNAMVTVILSEQDKIVHSRRIQRLLKPYNTNPNLRIVEMPGLGHNPFEEDLPAFMTVVEDVLEKDKEHILNSNSSY